MVISENILLPQTKAEKAISFDVRFLEDGIKKPVILFLHGFKGFKDWGHFNILASEISKRGFVFIKMNFSHNGTTPTRLVDFDDLEAFGHNNYSKELDDVGRMIDHICDGNLNVLSQDMDASKLILIGHSRGGGAAILKTAEDPRIRKVITWAAINDHSKRWPTVSLPEWRKKGVHYVLNGRTNQQMPMYYQIVEDYYTHESRLDIPKAVKKIKIPFMAIHGSLDETVPKEVLDELSDLNPLVQTQLIPKAGHTFGGKHPYQSARLNKIGNALLDTTLDFLNQNET